MPGDILDFSVNLNPLGPPPEIKKAVRDAYSLLTRYPDLHMRQLKDTLSRHENIPADWILPGNGAAELLFLLTGATNPKLAVIVHPSFSEYEEACRAASIPISRIILNRQDGFRFPQNLADRIPGDAGLVFLCSPNNPTGAIASPSLIRSLLDNARRNHFYLLVDESFLSFREDVDALSAVRFCAEYPQLIVLKSLTKLFAVPGVRIGYAICSSKQIQERIETLSPPWTVNIFAEKIAEAVLDNRAYIQATRSFLSAESVRFYRRLQEIPGVSPCFPGANFILFHADADACLEETLLSRGIRIRSCAGFPGLTARDWRVCVARQAENDRLCNTLFDIMQSP